MGVVFRPKRVYRSQRTARHGLADVPARPIGRHRHLASVPYPQDKLPPSIPKNKMDDFSQFCYNKKTEKGGQKSEYNF